jgi:hypothetical protein
MGEGRGVYWVLMGKPEGRRLDLQKVGCGCVDWMELAQDRDRWHALVSVVMNLQVP